MRKDLGVKTYFYPLPVLIIATYNEDGSANAMNAAWGGVCDYNQVNIYLAEHKTTDNLRKTGVFTIAFADAVHVVEADYLGLVSGHEVPDKIKKAGLHCTMSKHVKAPIMTDFPLVLECKVLSIDKDLIEEGGNINVGDDKALDSKEPIDPTKLHRVVGEIINVSVDEKVLDSEGQIDLSKLHIIAFDPAKQTYFEMGNVVGQAFSDGFKIK